MSQYVKLLLLMESKPLQISWLENDIIEGVSKKQAHQTIAKLKSQATDSLDVEEYFSTNYLLNLTVDVSLVNLISSYIKTLGRVNDVKYIYISNRINVQYYFNVKKSFYPTQFNDDTTSVIQNSVINKLVNKLGYFPSDLYIKTV